MTTAQTITIILYVISIACAILGVIFAIKAQKLSSEAQLLNMQVKDLTQQTTETEKKNMESFGGILIKLKNEPIEKFIDIKALEQYYASRIRKDNDYADIPYSLMEKLLLVAIYKKLCLSNKDVNDNANNND